MLTEDDLIALAQQDMLTLADGYCTLNRWEWPDWLPGPENPAAYRLGADRRRAAMNWIIDRVGMRVCSRRWNADMSDEEHEDFWRGHYEGNAAAKERYRQRLLRKCGVVPSAN